MEVAGHWRRQWAGTAEYGKVTEGGVTRQVARAMEVVQASAPGARVRVMRAAYHASAARGAPAASFLMHSSHSVISSGFNFLETPTTPTFSSKPLEISSTPLESSPESNTDTENYKVTEPDDYEISEPSKWISSTGSRSTRNPSEESSSTDNASIIDLDGRLKHPSRKYSYDSENSDLPIFERNGARMSPLLQEPVALSTLKYKSLLSGNNDWHNRRKSYSFEKSSSNETNLNSYNTTMMESSTDSGIYKSAELVNDSEEKINDGKLHESSSNDKHESFKSWLSQNRMSSFNKDNKCDSFCADNIALHSSKNISITLPMTVAEDYRPKVGSHEESRKFKKVEFSKTELHFTPDTGTVNIIDTDNKPQPSHVFRRRKSELITLMDEKPVTLLHNSDFFENNKHNLSDSSYSSTSHEESEFDETTATTKSILKNKIPKPKPYLLGENMEFGSSDDSKAKNVIYDTSVPLGVSLINKQLHERGTQEINSSVVALIGSRSTADDTLLSQLSNLNEEKQLFESRNPTLRNKDLRNNSYRKTNPIPLSPGATRSKTRQLRDSDLTYFGINNHSKITTDDNKKGKPVTENINTNDKLHSVGLVKKINGTSQKEYNDTPEYQNIPLKTNFAPIPTPRPRSKFDTKHLDYKESSVLTNDFETANETEESSRSRTSSTQLEIIYVNRSTSATPKIEEKSKHTQKVARSCRSPRAISRSPEKSRRQPNSPERIRRRSPAPEHTQRKSQEHTYRKSPEPPRKSPEPHRKSPKPHRKSPEHIRTSCSEHAYPCSPKKPSRYSSKRSRSPERRQSPPGIMRGSPDRMCLSQDYGRRSPERVSWSPDLVTYRRSREKIRTSPKTARHSQVKSRQCSSKLIGHSPVRSPLHYPKKASQRSPKRDHRSPEHIRHSPERASNSPKLTRCSPECKSKRMLPEKKSNNVNNVKINIIEAKSGSRDSALQKTIRHKLQNGNGERENKTDSFLQRIRNFENRSEDVVHVREKDLTAKTETGGKNTNKRMDHSLNKKSPVFGRKSPVFSKPVPIKAEEIKKSTSLGENGYTKFNEKSTRRVSPGSRQKPNKHMPNLNNAEILRSSKQSKISSPQQRVGKYIINYDDKNGSVSSVRKVKPGNSSLKTKSPKEKNRESLKEDKLKIKATEKIALLQSADDHPCELNYANRKWKRKMHVHRTCQLL